MRRLLVLLILFSCTQKYDAPAVIIWENNKAVAVSIDRSITDSVLVFLKGSQYPVLGEIETTRSRHIFTPAVPLERGQTYEVLRANPSDGNGSGRNALLAFTIPADSTLTTPALISIFPSCDTIPSNLLKIYLQFSEPMMEGRSPRFAQMFDSNSGDTVKNAFLDLQPELWNEDRTILTLWLDPGRIKQDLIPNKNLGVVLNENKTYRLDIAKGWKSSLGVATDKNYSRTFVTTSRDVSRPDLKNWSIEVHRDTIIVNTKETLDWSLLNSTLSIWSGDEEVLSNTISERCEHGVMMITNSPLTSGSYTLRVEARLEDLSGNNLNRLFETDVTGTSNKSIHKEFYTISFNVD